VSYLNSTRLHFADRFQANVSTVNNDPGHFDNATFIPSYQAMMSGIPDPKVITGPTFEYQPTNP